MKQKTHLMTFVVEEYFHSSALSSLISPRRWQRFDSRIEVNTRTVLDLLDEYKSTATFFVLGWVADKMPDLIEEIADRGHEVASKGYNRRHLAEMTAREFRDDARESKSAIEAATGRHVLGYRLGRGSLHSGDLWALDILAQEGYRYDSSFYPQFRSAANAPSQRFPHVHRHDGAEILELPLSTFGRDEWVLRVAGGNYVRQFPGIWTKQAFRHWNDHYESPFNMYYHVWEFDSDSPRITGASLFSRIRQYRNLSRVPILLRYFLQNYDFGSIADVFSLDETKSTDGVRVTARSDRWCQPTSHLAVSLRQVNGASEARRRQSVTIVIPCFNERPVLKYLAKTLEELNDSLGRRYNLSFLFVDDGSTDGTASVLAELYDDRPDHRIIRHVQNQGVAEASLTGIRNADTETVCVMDADCTYDPNQLQNFIPMLTDAVDLVTASPYHPSGQVKNVPRWRLFLSRNASRLYRCLMKNQLHTYTSCFRVYRKSAVEGIHITDGHFLGITEILWELDSRGAKIVECPATLEVRLLGFSKLKTVRSIGSHLKLLARIIFRRLVTPTTDITPLKPTVPEKVPHVPSHDRSSPRATV